MTNDACRGSRRKAAAAAMSSGVPSRPVAEVWTIKRIWSPDCPAFAEFVSGSYESVSLRSVAAPHR